MAGEGVTASLPLYSPRNLDTQFLRRSPELLRCRHAMMPGRLVFREAHAFALDCVRDDAGRFALHRFGLRERRSQRGVVVAVDRHAVPTGGGEALELVLGCGERGGAARITTCTG